MSSPTLEGCLVLCLQSIKVPINNLVDGINLTLLESVEQVEVKYSTIDEANIAVLHRTNAAIIWDKCGKQREIPSKWGDKCGSR